MIILYKHGPRGVPEGGPGGMVRVKTVKISGLTKLKPN
jgi:hypothetical protein